MVTTHSSNDDDHGVGTPDEVVSRLAMILKIRQRLMAAMPDSREELKMIAAMVAARDDMSRLSHKQLENTYLWVDRLFSHLGLMITVINDTAMVEFEGDVPQVQCKDDETESFKALVAHVNRYIQEVCDDPTR